MQTFELINKTSSSVSVVDEIIAIGFINHSDTPELLNYLQLRMNQLNAAEQLIADNFINMIRAKLLAAGDAGVGS